MELLQYDFVQRGLLAGVLIALSSSLVGVFLILRRLAFLGAGLSHFAFGGVALAVLLGVEPFLFSGILTLGVANLIELLRRKRRIGGDVSLAIVFSGGVALAVVLLSLSEGFREDVFSYLFGNVLIVSPYELYLSTGVFLITCAFLLLNFKSLLLMSFNEEMAKVRGIKVMVLNHLFVSLASLVIIVSIKAVGIILASSFAVIPAAAGIAVAKSLRGSLILSALISVLSTVSGILISLHFDLAPGGSIVMVMIVAFILSITLKRWV